LCSVRSPGEPQNGQRSPLNAIRRMTSANVERCTPGACGWASWLIQCSCNRSIGSSVAVAGSTTADLLDDLACSFRSDFDSTRVAAGSSAPPARGAARSKNKAILRQTTRLAGGGERRDRPDDAPDAAPDAAPPGHRLGSAPATAFRSASKRSFWPAVIGMWITFLVPGWRSKRRGADYRQVARRQGSSIDTACGPLHNPALPLSTLGRLVLRGNRHAFGANP
jgi:hypothetical protein